MGFPDTDLPLQFEAAFGADPDASPGSWSFTSLTSRHIDAVVNLKEGKRAGSKTADPSAVSAVFNNHDGELTPLRAMSSYWPNIKLDTPFRAKLRRADDTFTRTTANGLGTSDSGHTWSTSGGAASAYSTTGTEASIAVSATASDRIAVVDIDGPHQDVRVTVTTNATPVAGGIEVGVVARYTDASNFYAAVASVTTGGTVIAWINKRVAGVMTAVTSVSTGLSTATNKLLRFRVVEDRLQLKIWLTGTDEPDEWDLDVVDTSLTTGNKAGLYGRRLGSNSSPTTFTYDNFDTTHILHEGFTDSWKPDFIPTTDGFTSIVRTTASGPLRRLGQGKKPLRSPMFRTMSGVAPGDYVPNEYWSMEDGANSTVFASGLDGGQAVTAPSGVTFAADSDLVGSSPLPQFAAGVSVTFPIPAYTDTGHWMFTWMQRIDAEPAADTVYAEIRSAGTARRITLSVAPGAPGRVYQRTYNSANVLIAEGFNDLDGFADGAHPTEAEYYDHWVMHAIALTEDTTPGDTVCWLTMSAGQQTTGMGGVTGGAATGSAQSITLYGNGGAGFGHLGFFKDDFVGSDPAGFIVELMAAFNSNVAAMDGHASETEIDRLDRLSREERVRFNVLPGYDGVPMGPQLIDTYLANVLDCEVTGGGTIGEGNFGLTYIPRLARANRPAGITVDLSTYRVSAGKAPPVLAPILDDKDFRNEWEVSRPAGASAVAADFSRVQLEYGDSALPNVETDAQLPGDASWRLALSSLETLRWPGTPVDLKANPTMIGDWLGATCGLTRVVRTGLPSIGPDGDQDEFLEGVEHTIRRRSWELQYVGSPAEVYTQVGVYGTDPEGSAYDSGTSTLAASYDDNDTSFSVATATGHALWVTGSGAPNFPLDWEIDGIRITVTAISGSSSPQTATVQRSVDGYDKALDSGAAVRLWDPARYERSG